MIGLHKARINTAGAYLCIQGLYPFAIGTQLHHGRIPIFRLGGHREGSETGWQCAAREINEETGLNISPMLPPATYLLTDGDHLEAGLEIIPWQHETEPEPVPMLVVAYHRQEETLLSLMFLAQTEGVIALSSEVKGLLLLTREWVYRLCQEPTTLERYLHEGGQALLGNVFDQSLILEPFTQLRLLSRIFLLESTCSAASAR
jgi:NUDIX domain